MKWISVDERLPGFNIDILISVFMDDGLPNITEKGFLNKNDNTWYYTGICDNCGHLTPVLLDGPVTDWQPLPEPPK